MKLNQILISSVIVFAQSLKKVFIFFFLVFLVSCKDFTSWKSRYDTKVIIQFKPEMDVLIPEVLKDLRSEKLEGLSFSKFILLVNQKVDNFRLSKNLHIPLIADGNQVSFIINNEEYYHKVTIFYERVVSLISPEAGGLQQKYIIKNIEFGTKDHRRSIFKKFKIESSVPLKKGKKQHVTIYY